MSNFKNKVILTPPHKYQGFTLAETLITLVIIGVIAAITVPTLIIKHQKEQTVTRLKKAYSTLAQTTVRAIADNGPIETWEVGENTGESAHNFVKKYMFPYLNIMKDCGTSTEDSCAAEYRFLHDTNNVLYRNDSWTRFYLSDGSLICGYIRNYENQRSLWIVIDINGQKKPNILGKDIFNFYYRIYYPADVQSVGKIIPDDISFNRNDLVSTNPNNCNKQALNGGNRCAALIMKDGWQIKDDYPW